MKALRFRKKKNGEEIKSSARNIVGRTLALRTEICLLNREYEAINLQIRSERMQSQAPRGVTASNDKKRSSHTGRGKD